ncbi:helix-turn-helix domain-containing protein [Streptomyces sp. NPDC057474]|uniref:helix-turn-helix domain-containing protein n=1 Tax=Streptomyces sp. NPDC057474 TaxID=3346144 RepID=UPI0036887B9B
MDLGRDVQQFLTEMRARITPEEAGVTVFGGERRVPGLRREEVAQLAGVSTAYYTRMERGNLRGVSESVLRSLARTLRMDDTETQHFSTSPAQPPRAPRNVVASPGRRGCPSGQRN